MSNTNTINAEKSAMPISKSGFEVKTCSRCGGSGEYSYCQGYGKKCFKCRGNGIVYTGRGQLAAHRYVELLSKPANQIVVGDLVLMETFFTATKFEVVIRSERDELNAGCWHIVTASCNHGVSENEMVRVGASAEKKAEAKAAALAYQNSLTVSGKPKKR